MRTAIRAAPRLPENNDGSSYLYISLGDPTPKSIRLYFAARPSHAPDTSRSNAHDPLASLHSLRRVKRLTHIAPELQARLLRGNGLIDRALRCLRSARRGLWKVGDRAQGCAAHL